MAKLNRTQARKKKHLRIRSKISGTAAKPRLNIFKSHQNIEAQLIDDIKGITLAHATSKDAKEYGGNIAAATKVGAAMGDAIKKLKIEEVVFDRGGYIYHGRVKALAEAVREKGVKF